MVERKTIGLVWIFSLLICFLACTKPETPTTPEGEGNTPQKVEAYNLLDFSVKPIAEPISMGRNLAERFIEVRHSYWGNINSSYTADHITYPDVCAWLGAFWWAEAAQDQEIFDALVAKFDLLFTTEKHLQPNLNTTASNKVDYYVFGALPLHIYQFRKEQKYLDLGLKYADGQWKLPSNASSTEKQWHNQGYSWQTRLWIDDMFMITALQAQAYLATKDEKYLKRLLDEMLLYIDRLPGENGLYYHSSSAHYFWGRGNGWMAVGMTEVLRMLPDDPKWDTYREPLLAEYRTMMDALVKYQIYTGLWAQLVDHMTMWEETSGSAMFTYALISGVKNGWLEEKKYGTAARKGWLGLMDYLNSNYDIRNVCEGTGAQNSYTYYSERRKWVGDTHGQAGMLWCSFALTELAKQAKTLE